MTKLPGFNVMVNLTPYIQEQMKSIKIIEEIKIIIMMLKSEYKTEKFF